MTDEMPVYQHLYYVLAASAAALTVLGLLGRWLWGAAQRAIITEIEMRMVSQATFERTIKEMLDRSADRWREHDEREREYRVDHQKWGEEVMGRFTDGVDRLTRSHEAMAKELSEIRTLVITVIRGQQP
jgi:hypothetical protein